MENKYICEEIYIDLLGICEENLDAFKKRFNNVPCDEKEIMATLERAEFMMYCLEKHSKKILEIVPAEMCNIVYEYYKHFRHCSYTNKETKEAIEVPEYGSFDFSTKDLSFLEFCSFCDHNCSVLSTRPSMSSFMNEVKKNKDYITDQIFSYGAAHGSDPAFFQLIVAVFLMTLKDHSNAHEMIKREFYAFDWDDKLWLKRTIETKDVLKSIDILYEFDNLKGFICVCDALLFLLDNIKDVTPDIIPCETFNVVYEFVNHMRFCSYVDKNTHEDIPLPEFGDFKFAFDEIPASLYKIVDIWTVYHYYKIILLNYYLGVFSGMIGRPLKNGLLDASIDPDYENSNFVLRYNYMNINQFLWLLRRYIITKPPMRPYEKVADEMREHCESRLQNILNNQYEGTILL